MPSNATVSFEEHTQSRYNWPRADLEQKLQLTSEKNSHLQAELERTYQHAKALEHQLKASKKRVATTEQHLRDVQQELLHSRSFVQRTDSGDVNSILGRYQSIEDDIEALAFQIGENTSAGMKLARYPRTPKIQGRILKELYQYWMECEDSSTDYISCAAGYLLREALVVKIFRPFLLQQRSASRDQEFSLGLYESIALSRKPFLNATLSRAHTFLCQTGKSELGGGELWSPKQWVHPNHKRSSWSRT